MIKYKNYLNISYIDIIECALSLVLFLGILFWFPACGAKEDGSYMICHWAGIAIEAVSTLILVLSFALAFIPDIKVKMGIGIGIIGATIVNMLIPGTLIKLCMMDSMQCNAKTKPLTIVFSALVLVAMIVDYIYYLLSIKKNKKA